MIVINRKKRGTAGVSLIEAIVSMGIFGTSFVSLYAGMSIGFSIIGSARENLRATQVMVEKMETIRLYSWEQINTPGFIPTTFTESYYPSDSSSSGSPSSGTPQPGGGGVTGGETAMSTTTDGGTGVTVTTSSGWSSGVLYQGAVVIGEGPTGHTYSTDLKRVTINIQWLSGGRTQHRSMSTFVAKNGLQKYIY